MPNITGAEELDDDIELLSQAESPLFIEARKKKSEVIDVDAAPGPATPPVPARPTAAASTGKKYVAPASFYAPAQPKKAKGPL